MKRIDEIENMSLEELERISTDESVEVPEGLAARVWEGIQDSGQAAEAQPAVSHPAEKVITSQEAWQAVEAQPARRVRRPIFLAVGIAASLAVIAGIGLTLRPAPLKDTFDDPALAYAEVEKAFMKVSDGFEVGVKSVAFSQEVLRKPVDVIRSINMENTDNE